LLHFAVGVVGQVEAQGRLTGPAELPVGQAIGKIIGVDLDGVCSDFYGRMREIAAEWFERKVEDLNPEVSYGPDPETFSFAQQAGQAHAPSWSPAAIRLDFFLQILRKITLIPLSQISAFPVVISDQAATCGCPAAAIHFKQDVAAHRLGNHHGVIKGNFLPCKNATHSDQENLTLESGIRVTAVIKEIRMLRSASASQHEPFFNLYGVGLQSLGKGPDLVDEHDIATQNGKSFTHRDTFVRKDAIFVSGRSPHL
jgi:hypothetical protein